jgi:hypothetical protein
MATLVVDTITRGGVNPNYNAADAGGDDFMNDAERRTFLAVNNESAETVTVTIATSATMDGLQVADRDVAVGAGAEAFIGPFPPNIYNQADGTIHVTYSAVTDVLVAALKLAG